MISRPSGSPGISRSRATPFALSPRPLKRRNGGTICAAFSLGICREFWSTSLPKKCRGVVLQSFGAGNVPNEREYSFEDFIRQATGKGIPVVIASQFPANSTLHSRYAPGVAALEAGAIPTGNMTNARATVKFRWVLNQVNKKIQERCFTEAQKITEVRRMMEKIYVHEMTPVKGQADEYRTNGP
ncbi:MAG: hypothetical protein ACREU0_03750 [Burkholderiales bacterium]